MLLTYRFTRIALLSVFTVSVHSSPHAGANRRAVVPTTTGQIGVNPVSAILADPATNIEAGPILPDITPFLTVQDSTTKWIGVNTQFLTELTTLETISGTPTTVTTGVAASATTVTAATDGANIGDVSIILTPALVDKLTTLAQSVCGGAKHRKRDTNSCAADFINEAQAYPEFRSLEVSISLQEVANLLEFTLAAGTVVASNKYNQAAGILALIWLNWDKVKNIANTYIIPSSAVGPSATPTPTSSSPSPTTSSSACPTGSDIAACADATNCAGVNNRCASGQYISCPCAADEVMLIHPLDPVFMASQQVILAGLDSITAAPSAAATSVGRCGATSKSGIPGCWGQPGCAYYLAGNGQGCPGVDYCMCDGTNVGLLTATVSGSVTSNCAYITQPTANDCPTATASTPASSTAPAVVASSPTPAYSACVGSGTYDMRQASAMAAASSYCAGIAKTNPPFTGNSPGTCAVQNVGAVYQPPPSGSVEAGMSDIQFTASQDVISEYCKAKSMSDLAFSEDDCNTALGLAINNCDTTTMQTKHGGRASINCVMYTIFVLPFGNGYPCSYLNQQPCMYGWVSPCKAP